MMMTIYYKPWYYVYTVYTSDSQPFQSDDLQIKIFIFSRNIKTIFKSYMHRLFYQLVTLNNQQSTIKWVPNPRLRNAGIYIDTHYMHWVDTKIYHWNAEWKSACRNRRLNRMHIETAKDYEVVKFSLRSWEEWVDLSGDASGWEAMDLAAKWIYRSCT